MRVSELRKALKEQTDLRPVVRVSVTYGGVTSARLEISRTEALRLLRGADGDAEARVIIEGGWAWIG